MRSLATCVVLLVMTLIASGSLAHAQSAGPAGKPVEPAASAATTGEVEQLRSEVAAQRQMIEELKATVQRLAASQQQSAAPAVPAQATVQPVNAKLVGTAAQTEKKTPEKKPGDLGVTAGFNGEHFFIKVDNKFELDPYGYTQLDYRAYNGDGHPPDTFQLRRGRFGFQGRYGTHYEFALLADFADTSSTLLRDFYLNIKPVDPIQFQFGQMKEPFAQEEMTAASNLDFVERALTSLLYPSPATFRSPGAEVHGNIDGGTVQYWLGAFNGKGTLALNTTNEPQVLGRLRLYPWHKKTNHALQGFALGGAYAHGRSRGLSNELSFSGTIPDRAFNFFPSTRINGSVERANGEFTWTTGPFALRAEYDQLNEHRNGLAAATAGGPSFTNLPGVVAKGWYAGATYLLTGEKRPENGTPKVKHAMFGPEAPGEGGTGPGAWELKFRYSQLQAKALGTDFLGVPPLTPAFVATVENRMDEIQAGINWYPNYWVRYMLDFNIDRLKNPGVGGTQPQDFLVVLQRVQFRF